MSTDRGVQIPHLLAVAAAYAWRILVILGAASAALYLLVVLRLVVIPIFVALLISTVLVPVARRLSDRGVPRLLATWITVLGGLGLVVGSLYLAIPQFAEHFEGLGRDARSGLEEVIAWLVQGPLDLERQDIDRYLDQISEHLGEQRQALISGAFRGAYVMLEIVIGAFLSIVLTFFFLKDGDHIARSVISLLPERHRDDARQVADKSWAALGAYVRGTALVGVVNALAISITLLLLGVPLVVPLAMITFVGAFFPLVGGVVAGSLAALIALVTEGWVAASIVALVTVIVQQVEGDVLQPIVLGRAVKLHPLVVLLSLTAGAIVAGIAGAFLAVPLAAVAAVLVAHVRATDDAPPVEVGS